VYGSAVLFSTIVGFSFLGVKTCIVFATPLETLTHRYNFAFLAALRPVRFGFVKLNIKGKPKKNLIMTASFYIAFMTLQTVGLLFASSIASGIIFAIIPILVKIIAWIFLGEKGTWKQNAFVGVSVTGVIVMFLMGSQGFEDMSITGLVILFCSSLCMAVSNVIMRYVRGEYTPYAIAFSICMAGFLTFNIAAVAYGALTGTLTLAGYLAPLTHRSFILSIVYLGIPSTLISSLIMSYMLARIEAVKATIFGNLSTAISIVAGVLFLNEPLQNYHIICTALIIIGVIGTSLAASPKADGDRLTFNGDS